MNLKNNIRRLRFDNGEITQDELSKKLDVSRQTVHSIETGKFNPSVKLALAMARFFNVKVEDIFYIEEEKND